MNTPTAQSTAPQAQAVADLFQSAAKELLLAYQRNKEATRHHASGAFRAALHHARMSCVHSAAAHECLMQALEKSRELSSPFHPSSNPLNGLAARRDH